MHSTNCRRGRSHQSNVQPTCRGRRFKQDISRSCRTMHQGIVPRNLQGFTMVSLLDVDRQCSQLKCSLSKPNDFTRDSYVMSKQLLQYLFKPLSINFRSLNWFVHAKPDLSLSPAASTASSPSSETTAAWCIATPCTQPCPSCPDSAPRWNPRKKVCRNAWSVCRGEYSNYDN